MEENAKKHQYCGNKTSSISILKLGKLHIILHISAEKGGSLLATILTSRTPSTHHCTHQYPHLHLPAHSGVLPGVPSGTVPNTVPTCTHYLLNPLLSTTFGLALSTE